MIGLHTSDMHVESAGSPYARMGLRLYNHITQIELRGFAAHVSQQEESRGGCLRRLDLDGCTIDAWSVPPLLAYRTASFFVLADAFEACYPYLLHR